MSTPNNDYVNDDATNNTPSLSQQDQLLQQSLSQQSLSQQSQPPLSLLRMPIIACFWIGICGLLHVALWVRIMSIRMYKPTETHKLNNLKTSTDNINLRVTRAHGNYTGTYIIIIRVLFYYNNIII
jgi:hypothetical protein